MRELNGETPNPGDVVHVSLPNRNGHMQPGHLGIFLSPNTVRVKHDFHPPDHTYKKVPAQHTRFGNEAVIRKVAFRVKKADSK